MTKNPFLNALAAIAYISLVASFMFYGSRAFAGTPDGVIIPVTMLSLFVLSAALMGLIFFYHPVQMYLDGDKKAAASLVVRTVAIFASVTFVLMAALIAVARYM